MTFNTVFHISLREGKIPQQWKEVNVRALLKKEVNVRALLKKEANLCAPITGQSVLPPLYVNYLNH